MVTQKSNTTGVRLNEDDRKLVRQLRKKLGVNCANFTHLVRMALRALAEKEQVGA